MGTEAPGTRAVWRPLFYIFSDGSRHAFVSPFGRFRMFAARSGLAARSSVFILQPWRDNICPRFSFHTYPCSMINPCRRARARARTLSRRVYEVIFSHRNSISPCCFFFYTNHPPPLFCKYSVFFSRFLCFIFACCFSMTVHRIAESKGEEWIGSPSSLSSITFYLIVSRHDSVIIL